MNRFSFRKKKRDETVLPPTPKKAESWPERLLDEENYWLKANNMEDDGNLVAALEYYTLDVIKCINNNYIIKTALSCSCAADCLYKLGHKDDARKLYSLSAALYEKNAGFKIKTSLRESLWSLEQAYSKLMMAKQIEAANKVYARYRLLASKITPTFLFEDAKNVLAFKELPQTIEEEGGGGEEEQIDRNKNENIMNENSYSDSQSVGKCIKYINEYLQRIDQNDNMNEGE